MPLLAQTYLKGENIPKTLQWELYSGSLPDAFANASSSSSSSPIVGIAMHVDDKAVLQYVAVALGDAILVVKADAQQDESLKRLLDGRIRRIAGFSIVKIVLHMRNSMRCNVRGYDLPAQDEPSPGGATKDILDPTANSFKVDQLWDVCSEETIDANKSLEYLCLRAWISGRLASSPKWADLILVNKAAEASSLSAAQFKCIFRMVKELHMMDAATPWTSQNDFTSVQYQKDGKIVIDNDRYKSRVRKSDKTRVVLTDARGTEHAGRAVGAVGRKTFVNGSKRKSSAEIEHVRVEGRVELNNAEKARDKFLLQLLRRDSKLNDASYPFIGYLWFPFPRAKKNVAHLKSAKIRKGQGGRALNQSQSDVVEAMLDGNRPIVVTHGPPGTGKTTTISVAMREVYASRKTAWVVAQSNVGVKNIAESLCRHDVDFKLLVSKEFHHEWHEHIYEEVNNHLILTDKLKGKRAEVLFNGTRIVLSTISMLSNPDVRGIGLFRVVPLEVLVVDEASQIGELDYLHLFGRFTELKKVCFFGDPKQRECIAMLDQLCSSLVSISSAAIRKGCIFDIPHLKSGAHFLDTQYRMPLELGSFISRSVYDSRLESVHDLAAKNCVKFVDVWNGEERKAGKSWKNMHEVQIVVHLVRHYYAKKDYCIITPYDAQRNAIQRALKEENLRCDNVFNVDSFQGNEAQYVLVSVVRTAGPGFLKSQNRVNVMLTRCKAGMVLVSKRDFAHYSNTRKTLLGKLVLHWEKLVGKSNAWCKLLEVVQYN